MFNMYTKLATALGAFALLFSTGAWGQCAAGEIAIDYSISNGSYPSEISWTLNDAAGTSVFNGGAGVSGTWCLTPGDYTFIGTDSFGDGWNGATATFTNSGATIGFFELTSAMCGGAGCSASIVLTVSADVPGCTDPTADNYNPAATVDDGSCCLDNIMTINLFDSFGDGWTWAGDFGGLVLNGDSVEFDAGDQLTITGCFAEGCYTGEIVIPLYASEGSWNVVNSAGTVINSGAGVGEIFFWAGSDACVIAGCTDVSACNYNAGANLNDGSCEYLTCAGCTDPTACNYDDTATLDNGSCDYSCIGCLDSTAVNYCADCTVDGPCEYCEGAFAGTLTVGGGSWDSEISWSLNLGGTVVISGGAPESANLCLEAGCYTFDMFDSFGDGWNGAAYSFTGYDGVEVYGGDISDVDPDGEAGTANLDFNGGACTYGCTDAGACNYDATAAFDDGSCDYSCVGCMDSAAANYDPNATIDSGECIYCDPGTFIFQVDMFDSFGDGWQGCEYFIFDNTSGALVDSGSIATAFVGDGLTFGYDLICMAPGCYLFQTTSDTYPGEVSIDLSDQFGTNYGTVGTDANYGIDFTLTGTCGFSGCTDPAANNFNPSASTDDGSCLLPPSNDDVADAEALFCGASAAGTLENANDNEMVGGTIFGNETTGLNAAGVWYVINSDADQQITMTTCDTPANDVDTDYATNTDLAVFTMDIDGNLNIFAQNEDGCATGFHSTITWSAMTGVDYYVRVEGSGGNNFVIAASCNTAQTTSPANDNCDGAIAQVTGVTFTGNLCGANAEELYLPWEGTGTAYAVYFTFNSANYNTFYFNTTNISNDAVGFAMLDGNTCDDLAPFVGCVVTGTCAGSVEGFLPDLEPNTDYYFVVWTDDQSTCGDFEFTTTGIILGCTDASANNYNEEANQDDGSCDFLGVTQPNDACADAITLECNAVTSGSTGGSTNIGAPLNVDGCDAAPGAGVWYTFVGDSSLHTLSTCGSAVDTKVNIYTADTLCGGGGIDTPPADACDTLVTVNYSVGGGSWDSEISWSLSNAAGDTLLSGFAPESGSLCLAEGDYNFNMFDAYGDGWNGGGATFTNGLGDVILLAGLDGLNDNGASATATLSVAPYSTDPVYIAGDFTCFASAQGSDGTGVCTLFDSDDVNFEFVSEPGVLYYVYVGAQDTDGNPATDDNGAFDIEFTCVPVVEGCMQSIACNYNAAANVDDGSCDIWSCICADTSGTAVQFYMNDAFGDGWNGSVYTVTSLAGDTVATGTLDDAGFFVDNDNYTGPEYGFDLFCLDPGCYNVEVTDGDWPSEVSWEVLTEDGSVLTSGGPTAGVIISVGGAVCGCTDTGACNYDATATDEDGTCEYVTCAGCTDATSCNYDSAATIEDGSCCYDNCVTINMNDSFGDGWNGANYTLTSVDGTLIGSGTIVTGSSASDTYCLADGCYSIAVTEGSWPSEISWTVVGAFAGIVSGGAGEVAIFNVGSGDQCVIGCDIACACNYNPATNIPDVASCVFDGCTGCTYEGADNYDATAVSDDGSCTFSLANPCPADLNGDGSVSTADLLEFLTAFGQIC
jgi:hypothetical protein